MMHLAQDEIRFHPQSFGDPDGRVFVWNGEVYRGLGANSAEFFSALLHDGLLHRLSAQGLVIETELSDVSLDGYAIVLKHRRVPFVSYPDEWSAPMLLNAGRLIVTLALELARSGLLLKDSHPWNVLFDDTKPVYVDLTSIAPLDRETRWVAYEEFCKYCFNPLLLMLSGHDRIARVLINQEDGVGGADLLPYLQSGFRRKLRMWRWRRALSRTARSFSMGNGSNKVTDPTSASRPVVAELEQLCSELNALPQPTFHLPPQNLQCSTAIMQMVADLAPATLLDVSGQHGKYALLAAETVKRVVRFDDDPQAAAWLYLQARAQSLPILSLVMDFRKPSPALGLANHWALGASERLACDLVLALDVLPTWVFRGRLTFDHIAEGLHAFSKRSALVEFVSRERPDVREIAGTRCPWYALDNLLLALNRRFTRVTTIASDERSSYLLCEH
jgi:hypothetical protein